MTFNPSIPQPGDLISVSQGQILINFGQSNTIFAFDHYAFNDATSANRGLHKQITFPATRAASSPTGAASMFYSKTVSAVAEPFFTNSAADGTVWWGGTGSGKIATASGANQSSGSMTFPNGMILKWGYLASVTDNSANSFPVAFPTACFTVVASQLRNATDTRSMYVKPGSITASAFTLRTDSGSSGATYWAIGR